MDHLWMLAIFMNNSASSMGVLALLLILLLFFSVPIEARVTQNCVFLGSGQDFSRLNTVSSAPFVTMSRDIWGEAMFSHLTREQSSWTEDLPSVSREDVICAGIRGCLKTMLIFPATFIFASISFCPNSNSPFQTLSRFNKQISVGNSHKNHSLAF